MAKLPEYLASIDFRRPSDPQKRPLPLRARDEAEYFLMAGDAAGASGRSWRVQCRRHGDPRA